MKKNTITQELVNVFPSWARIRTDDQSVGQQLLNAVSTPIERMQKEIRRAEANAFVTTADLDQPDLLYKLVLGPSFVFDTDTSDPFLTRSLPPTVSGTVGVDTYLVNATTANTLEEVWRVYLPDRFSLGAAVSGVDHELLDLQVDSMPWSGVALHHLSGGHLWIECISGVQYIRNGEFGALERGQVVLTGETRKGTIESENIVFPWDQRQKSLRDWKKLTKVEALHMESGVNIKINSGDYNATDYLSQWNFRFSPHRKKVDEFWQIGEVEGVPTLDRVEFATDEWQQLIQGQVEKTVVQSFEPLDSGGAPVTPEDLALQPYSDRCWIIDQAGTLYVYDLTDSTPENIDLLKGRTAGPSVTFEVDFREIVYGESFTFIPWHIRPLSEILRYRIWYQDPSGARYGLKKGVTVPITDNFWIVGQQIKRTVEDVITFTPSMRGEYLFVIEADFTDGRSENERMIMRTRDKKALEEWSISSLISGIPLGLEFDSDQKLWVRTDEGYFRIDFHYDVMLIDYENKILYFREKYNEITVETNG